MDFIYPVLFALPAGALFYLASGLSTARVNRTVSIALVSVLSLVYEVQLIYYCIFRTPLTLYSLVGAEDTLQFGDIVLSAILKNSPAVILLFVPLAVLTVPERAWRRVAALIMLPGMTDRVRKIKNAVLHSLEGYIKAITLFIDSAIIQRLKSKTKHNTVQLGDIESACANAGDTGVTDSKAGAEAGNEISDTPAGKNEDAEIADSEDNRVFRRLTLKSIYIGLAFFALSFAFAVGCVNLTRGGDLTQYDLYYKVASPELSIGKLGLLTTVRLDLQRLVFGFGGDAGVYAAAEDNGQDKSVNDKTSSENGSAPDSTDASGISMVPGSTAVVTAAVGSNNDQASRASGLAGDPSEPVSAPIKEFNTMDIDFNALIAGEKDPALLDMHKYFSSVEPIKTNKYTGMFKGCNLILITAEGFSPYFITPELTPVLYRMATQGFVFDNFYNPLWGVSTSDGEYVGCTGLIPKTGVWSFYRSGNNLLPFVMGNQFSKLGYVTKAYHDHTYTYYKRNISHPNMGYDYKGVGNGLDIKKTWPESDLEMIDATAGDFTADKPFHIYYMTVSGHMNYSFSGNAMSVKNKSLVENLPYSEPSKAYIACNLELEAAMSELVAKLEAAGIADRTVIALSGDHYPYGLPRECIDELAGHKVENNFELYKSTFILWKEGMQPVQVDKPCSALDRIPTLSNLFGLGYDSRLLMGYDILSDSPPLVIFANRSWITDRAMYDSRTGTAKFTDGTEQDSSYVKAINKKVADKFKYSTKILDTDYYRKIEGYLK